MPAPPRGAASLHAPQHSAPSTCSAHPLAGPPHQAHQGAVCCARGSAHAGDVHSPPEADVMRDYMGHARAKTVQPGGGMVATDHWQCSAIGRDVLQVGGQGGALCL